MDWNWYLSLSDCLWKGSESSVWLPGTSNFPSNAAFVAFLRKVTDPCSVARSYSTSLWHFQGILWELRKGNSIQRLMALGADKLLGGRGLAGVMQDVWQRVSWRLAPCFSLKWISGSLIWKSRAVMMCRRRWTLVPFVSFDHSWNTSPA